MIMCVAMLHRLERGACRVLESGMRTGARRVERSRETVGEKTGRRERRTCDPALPIKYLRTSLVCPVIITNWRRFGSAAGPAPVSPQRLKCLAFRSESVVFSYRLRDVSETHEQQMSRRRVGDPQYLFFLAVIFRPVARPAPARSTGPTYYVLRLTSLYRLLRRVHSHQTPLPPCASVAKQHDSTAS